MESVWLAVAFCLFGTCLSQLSPNAGSSGQGQTEQGSCTQDESSAAFQNCMFSFGMHHRNYFGFLQRNAPNCRAEVFSCQEVDVMMRCLNTQPTTVISNQCWVRMPTELTLALNRYGIPCSYDDLAKQCRSQHQPLIPVSQRRTSGRGMSNNPMRSIMQNIFSYIAMMVLGGGGGMFGGIASAFGA